MTMNYVNVTEATPLLPTNRRLRRLGVHGRSTTNGRRIHAAALYVNIIGQVCRWRIDKLSIPAHITQVALAVVVVALAAAS